MICHKRGRGCFANSTEKASSNQMLGVPRRYRLKPSARANKRGESTQFEENHAANRCSRCGSVSFARVSLEALPSMICCSMLLAWVIDYFPWHSRFFSIFTVPLTGISEHLTEGAGDHSRLSSR